MDVEMTTEATPAPEAVAEPKDALIATDATPPPNATTKPNTDERKGADTKASEETAKSIDLKAKVKAKINDREEDVSVEDLIRHYQKEKAADEKFRKSAEIEKRLTAMEAERERERAMLKEDPWSVLKEQGLDPDELAERRLLEKIKLESMDEHERRAHDLGLENQTLKEKAEKWEAEQKERKEKLEIEHKNKLKLEQVQSIDKDLTETLQERGLKPTPQVLEAVAQHMLAHLTHKGGNRSITVKESLDFVLKQQDTDFYSRVESEDIGAFMEKLSPARRDAIRKYYVNKITNGQTTQRREPTQSRTATPKRGSTDSFFNNLEKKFGS